ncbi:MAG TPA: cytochrome c biogenesis protein CcdA [Myxococcota bacterium]|nr:cytochrome c biogenesis protein CcdA [Myxococcota bacterium]HRY92160.1 cytochrome c biogenesis protein CcdA [Myxococcota bacterium]HSA20648.1 cytochrome c biogenesis protein CcdA [Myxococcota bacterium]
MSTTRVAASLCLALSALLAARSPARADEPLDDRHPVRAQLVADVDPAAAGEELQVGLLLEMAPGWHIYWTYPGNTGKPTQVAFRTDERLAKVLEPRFPAPRVFDAESIEELSFGYEGSVLIPAAAFVHEAPPEGGALEVRAEVSWLACKTSCVTGRAAPSLRLALAEASKPSAWAPRFKGAAEQLSSPLPPSDGWLEELGYQAGRVHLHYHLPGLARAEALVPRWTTSGACKLVAYSVVPSVEGKGFVADVELAGPACLPQAGGLLLGARAPDEPSRPFELAAHAPPAKAPGPDQARAAPGVPPGPGSPEAERPWWLLLVFAFLGGLILNVMPCVIPVVVPKLLHVVRTAQRTEDPAERRRLLWTNSVAYAAGVLATMASLGLLVVVLKAVGHEVGWGFQFQNPWFLVFMIALLLVLGLGMLHVFPLQAASHADDLKSLRQVRRASPLLESFLTGLLVTFLGTPCTAPFLGPAMGYAFTAPAYQVVLFLMTVGLGLASPFLLLGAWIGWTRILPTRVTERYDRIMRGMAFLLFATAVWLLDVLGEAYGQAAAQGVLWFALALGGLAWAYGLLVSGADRWPRRLARLAPLAALATLAGWLLLDLTPTATGGPAGAEAASADGLPWEPFSEGRLGELRREGKSVFVDFTAGWCMNCKANERLVIETPPIRDLVRQRGIATLKADFTRYDPVIHAWLKRHGRAGVPMYLVYPACAGDEAVRVLPEILTGNLLSEALEAAGPSRAGCGGPR